MSDAHGNLPALEAVIADARTYSPDIIAHVGDMVNGPSSAAVMDRLLVEGWRGVFGNHEDYVLRYDDPAAPVRWRTDRFAPTHWTRRNLTPSHLGAIGAWPLTHRPHPELTLVHGTTTDLRGELRTMTPDARVREMYREILTAVVACGHTHHPVVRRLDGRLYVNVGSTGLPLQGSARATYGLLTRHRGRWDAEIRQVSYDTGAVLAAAQEDGWLTEGGGVAATMLHEMLSGVSWTTPFIRWWDATCPNAGSVDAYRAFARIRDADPII